MKGKRRLLTVGSICLVLLIGLLSFMSACGGEEPAPGPGETPGEVYTWKMQGHVPASDSIYTINHPHFVKMLEENTNGRVKVELFAAPEIVAAPDLLTATTSGVLQLMEIDPGYLIGTIPVATIPTQLPNAIRNHQEVMQLQFDYGIEELLREEYAKSGLYLLTHYPVAINGAGIMTKNKLTSLAELQGVKIRCYGGTMEFLNKLGMEGVNIPFAETYLALTTGTVDGVATAWNAIFDIKAYEPAPYGIWPPLHGGGAQAIFIELGLWNSLPKDLQTIISLTAREHAMWAYRYFEPVIMSKVFNDLKAQPGVEFNTLSEADQATMLKVAMEMWDEMATADAPTARGVQIVKDYYKEIGRIK